MRKRTRRLLRRAIVFAAAVALIAAVCTLCFLPKLRLSEKAVTLEAGQAFDAESYIKKPKNADKGEIEISEKIDNTKPGEYEVVYKYKNKKKTLKVEVVDTVAPKLTAKANLVFFAGDAITAEAVVDVADATACELKLDARGQDLSTVGEYSVSVSATDLGGNKASCDATLTIRNPDTKAPVISGTKNVSVKLGDTFDSRAGVTVTDDYDKEPLLTVDEGTLDTKKAGKYTVTYVATDKSGNKASVKRTVTVLDPNAKPQDSTTLDLTGVANQPYLVAVNRAMCTITVYSKGADGNYTVPVKAMPCSVGRSGHETPTGRFNTTTRYDWRLMVDGSYGRYAIRIKGSIMFHSVCYYTKDESNLEYEEYNKLGSPASLGCVRLCLADIKWIYDNCPDGFPAVIYDDYSSPGPLGKPASIKIDVNDTEKRGYDPTDWSAQSPYNR